MPHGVKGSGKTKAATEKKTKGTAEKKAKIAPNKKAKDAAFKDTLTKNAKADSIKKETKPAVQAAEAAAKSRKAYPSREERIKLVDRQIERLTKLNTARVALIEKTEATLNERRDALQKSTAMLEKALNKKERLVAAQSKPAKAPKQKLTMEERKARMAAGRAAARAAKKEKQAQVDQLLDALKGSGKSVEELLAELKG